MKTYLGTAVFLLLAFYFLHYQGNQLPRERSYEVVREALEKNNLLHKNHRPPLDNSVRNLTGHAQWHDCMMLIGMITPPSNRVEDAVVLKGLIQLDYKKGWNYCDKLYQIVIRNSEHRTVYLKHRYWHGFKALTALALRWDEMDLFQVNIGIKVLTYFSFLLLTLIALAHSFRLLAILSPFIFHGFLFSGIPYYGGFTYSLAYLFSISVLATLVLLMKSNATARSLRLFFFASGIISSYLFSLDGHLVSLLPMSIVILYFGREHVENIRKWSFETISFLLSFLAGFTLSMGVNQLAKSYYIGFNEIFSLFGKNLAERIDRPLPHHETFLDALVGLIPTYINTGFMGNKTLFFCVALISCVTLTAAIAASAFRAYAARNLTAVFGVVVVLAAMAMVLIRLAVFPQHTSEHPHVMSRYMFVPAALSWSALIAALYAAGGNRPWKKQARGAREAEKGAGGTASQG